MIPLIANPPANDNMPTMESAGTMNSRTINAKIVNESITTEIVGLSNAVSSIGTFDIGDVDASNIILGPDARWDFSPGIGSGESSFGLVFSSDNLPMLGNSLTISASQQGFLSAFQFGVPTPGSEAIPEPASVLLLGLGVLVTMTQLSRKRSAQG